MTISPLLGQIIGISLTVGGVGMLLNAGHYHKVFQKIMKDEAVIFMLGLIMLVTGVALVLTHNIWDASWNLVITIIGWSMLLKGSIMLLLPRWMITIYEKLTKIIKPALTMGAVIWIVFGLILTYYSFSA